MIIFLLEAICKKRLLSDERMEKKNKMLVDMLKLVVIGLSG